MATNLSNTISLPQMMPTQGIGAGDAARLTMKSAGLDVQDPMGIQRMTNDVMADLRSQGVEADPNLVRMLSEQALKSQVGGNRLVTKATDPLILPQPYVSPTDFTAQYPVPLDPTEILVLCNSFCTFLQ